MKLNFSSTSINTKSSVNEAHRKRSRYNEDQIFFDLTDFQQSEVTTPISIQLKESNSNIKAKQQKHFFPQKGITSENKLPSLTNKYHITNNVSQDHLLRRRLFKENLSVVSLPTNKSSNFIKNQSTDFEKLTLEPILSPNTKDYFNCYKNSNKLADYSSYNNSKQNIYVNLNKVMEQEKCMPRKIQIIDKENNNEICVAGQLSSQQYIKMFAAGLGSDSHQKISKLNLNYNNLDNQDLQIILNQMPKSVTNLELKNNKISKFGSIAISSLLIKPQQFIIELNLEGNQLADNGLINLLDSIQNNKCLKVLNLSNNLIQDTQMEYFGKILKKNSILQELYLHYNKIRNGAGFFKGLCKNSVLKVLDFSFNKLGNSDQCVQSICSLIGKPHPELIHLDISNNNFNETASKQIANELAFNKIIYGFHFTGNSNYFVNHRGYLMPQQNEKTITEKSIIEDSVEESERRQLEIQVQQFEQSESSRLNRIFRINSVDINLQSEEICWICQGWVEVQFKWTQHKSGYIEAEPLYIHLDFENFRPTLMEYFDDCYIVTRMCPPNTIIRYFFSNPVLNVQLHAKDQKTIETQLHSNLRNFGVILEYSNGKCIQSEQLHIVNMINTGLSIPIFDKQRHYIQKVDCKPREPEKIIEFDITLAQKRQWSLETSFFKEYDEDTEVHLEQCLENDLESSKIAKHLIGMNEMILLKETIKKYYKYIIQCYKFLTAQTCDIDFPKISIQTIQQFYLQSKNNQIIKQVDWDICLISTIVIRELKSQYIQDRTLVRYQFLELLIRLAKETYVRYGDCKTIAKAFEKMLQPQGQFGFIQDYGYAQQWRNERYWTQIMDLTIKSKLPFLKQLFFFVTHYSHKPIQKERFVSFTDFKQMLQVTELIPDYISENQSYYLYLVSLQLQIDELSQKRHFEMQFIEFVEALARLAEFISPNSNTYQIKYMNSKQRRTLPLYVKFEGLLYIIYHKIKKFDIDINIIERSVLQSHQVKKLGIQVEDQNNSSSEEGIDDQEGMSNMKQSCVDPLIIIGRLLHDDECRISFKDNMSNQSSGQKKRNSIIRSDSLITKKNLVRKNTIYNQLQQIKMAQIENEMAEIAEYEESTPLNRLRIQQRKITRSKFDNLKFDGPQFKYDLIDSSNDL